MRLRFNAKIIAANSFAKRFSRRAVRAVRVGPHRVVSSWKNAIISAAQISELRGRKQRHIVHFDVWQASLN